MEQSGVYTTFQILRRVLIFSASLTLIVFSNLGNLSARLLGEIFIAPFFIYSIYQLIKITNWRIDLNYIKYIYQISAPIIPCNVSRSCFWTN